MAELNNTDHLVRPDKDTILNGYDNEAYLPQTEEEDESACDDDHLRSVVTENGQTTPLSNGHTATPVNGRVVVADGNDTTSKMDDSDSHKPLDTRLHHYVPVEDIDKKILNGSETHVSIPDDAVISFSSGRVRVKKCASSSPRLDNNRDSIPLEDMHPPSYNDGDDKSKEKAELEVELSNHKNGVWSTSDGLNAYGSAESHFISEKLNGKSKSSGGDEAGKLPVNNHRKCLSRESSISTCSSEHKPTGEKLYFTEDSRKICPNLKRGVICGIIVVVISIVLLLCVLAATGIILSKSENTRYESGHSLPSMDSISHAGHSFRPRPKVPHKFSTETTPEALDTVSQTPTVTSKVPLPNESSHSQTIVPNALVGEFTILDENFTDDLNDNSSQGYMNLARNLETELRRIFRENGGTFDTLKILNFRPGSIKVKFVLIWSSDKGIVLSDKAKEILTEDLRQKNNSFYNFFPVDIGSIHFVDVFDECRTQKGGCSFDCMWNYDTLSKTCLCQPHMYLLPDGKTCALMPDTSSTSSSSFQTNEPTFPTSPAPETTVLQVDHSQGNRSFLVPFTEVLPTKETVTTQSLVEENTTVEDRPISTSQEHTFPVDTNQTYPEITTPQQYDGINTETSSTNVNYFTEQGASDVTAVTTLSTDAATENPLFDSSTETSSFADIPTEQNTDSTPISEESITKQVFSTIASESHEIILGTEATTETVPELPITTMETETTTTHPLLGRTDDGTTLKFRVVEPTTEVYTFKSEPAHTDEYLDSTLTSVTLSDQNETAFTESTQKTDQPVTEHFPTYPEIEATDTTVKASWTDSDINRGGTLKEDWIESSTFHSLTEIDLTQPAILSDAMDNETFFTSEGSEVEHPTIPPMILVRNDTEDVITTENPEVLTTTSFFTPYSNRTSAVRYIDNYTDLYENITDDRFLYTDASFTDTAFENTTFFSESSVNISESDITTNNPLIETTIDQFLDNVSKTKPTEKAPFWIKKIYDNITDYAAGNDSLNATEPVSETVTLIIPTSLNNFTIPTEIFTNDSFPAEDEVYREHASDTLTLPPNIEETDTTPITFDAETIINSFPTFPETEATTLEISISNITEHITSAFDENMETTTPPSSMQEITNKSVITESSNQTLGINHTLSENVTAISTDDYSELPSEVMTTSNTIALFENTTDSTTLSEMGTTFLNAVSSIEISTQTVPQIATMLIETTDTDIFSIETTNPTTIFDSEIGSSTFSNETAFFPTNMSVEVTEISTETANYNNNTYNNETTDIFKIESDSLTTSSTVILTETLGTNNESETEFSVMNTTELYETTFDTETKPVTDLVKGTVYIANHTYDMELNETIDTESSFISNKTEEVTTIQAETTLIDGNVPIETSTESYTETTTSIPHSFETEPFLTDEMNSTEVNLILSNATSDNSTEEETTYAPYVTGNTTSIESNDTKTHYNWKNQDENSTNEFGVISDGFNATDGNYSFDEDYGNYTTTGFEGLLNETTTNASVGIVCRDDQFICEPLNSCLNYTFMCDGIQDCPDGVDEFSCQDSCGSNFRCSNFSNMCIMSQAHCDGIWDCENGTDEENCSPNECAKHEVMCLDKSKCIRPSDICDLKYDCKDRSDEVGCVERTTCESGGKFFCNDGLCIPWSLKCDGEFDCKDKEDEGNCTCLNDEFQCNDGKCLKSSSRCDGHQDCHDADDEMGCVNVDSQHIVTTYEPYSGTWALLCAEDFNLDDGHYLCQELGFGHALKTEKLHVSFNGTWMAMRRENLTDASLWTERVSFVESCTSSAAAVVECQKFACGEYSGLLHRRKRDVSSSSSTQWPFIGYTSTFNSNRGCMSEILTPIWLITSAECLLTIREPFNGSDWYVRTNIGRGGDTGLAQNHEVLRIVSHPHSSKFRSLILRDYDVALVRLKHALVFVSDKIGAICPPEEQVPPGITCFSGVLGTQKPRAPPPTELTINSLALQIMERRNCNSVEHYDNQINSRMLCTQSSEGHTICDNDEGTPLMCLTGINKWFLAGMLTYQRYCEVYSKHPAVFSNLFAMRKFIDQVTGQKQYEISYDPNVYIIIPPTTPSPTVPDTTTFMYTTTESLNTTEWDYTAAGMFNESEADTTPAAETSLSSMIEDGNVTELERVTTVGPVELRGEEHFTTTMSEDLLMGENVTEPVVGIGDTGTVVEDALGWNDTSDVTTSYGSEAMDNLTTLQPFLFAPGMNSTATTLLDDGVTLQEQFGYENASDIEAEMYESRLFNMSGMPNKTHDSMIGLTTEMYLGYENVTEMFEGIAVNSTEQVVADSETTASTLLEETVSPFIAENATDLDAFKPPMNDSQILPSSNETVFISPERLTLTTLHPELDGEIRTDSEINSTLIDETDVTDSSLVFQDIPTHYNLSEVNESTTADSIMKAARLESETMEFTENPFLTNFTTVMYDWMNKTEEFKSLGTEPTEFPTNSEVENATLAEVDRVEATEKSFLLKEDHPKAELEEEKMELTENPNLENETATFSPDLSHLPEDSNLTTNTATELETTDYNTETPLFTEETSTDLSLIPTTLMPETHVVYESEVGTDGDLSLTLNDSHEIIVEPVTSFDTFGNFEEANSTEAYLSRGRMLDNAGNSSILYDLEHQNDSSPNITSTTSEVEPDPYIMVELGGLDNATTVLELVEVFNSTKTDTIKDTTVTESSLVLATEPVTLPLEAEGSVLNISLPNLTNNSSNDELDYFMKMLNDEAASENTTSTLELADALNTTGTGDRNSTAEIEIESLPGSVTETSVIMNDSMKSLRYAAELTVLGLENSTVDQRDTCGIWNPPSVISEGSQKPFYAVWPSLGYLQKNNERCPASLLSPRFVVTSVNCLLLRDSELDGSKWYYTGGLYHNDSSIDGQQNFMAQEIIPYPNASLPILFNNDNLAVIKLRNDIQLNKYSENVCLPKSETPYLQECYTTGWKKGPSGKEEFFSIAVDVISQEACNNTNNLNGQLPDNLICATLNDTLPICEMISGAPLFCLNSDQRWEIQGVLTNPNPCNENQPATYYSIPSIQEWITQTITSLIEADW